MTNMASKIFLPILMVSLIAAVPALSQHTGEDLVKKMYARYSGKWYHSLTFNQTTEFYKNDSLKGSQIWYEAIVFPDQFRIDFGSTDSGNAVIFKGDSSYSFKRGQLQAVRANSNDLIFLLGGLYFYPLEQTILKFRTFGFNLDKIHPDQWKGKAVWVIGDTGTGKNVNQLWVDRDNFFVVRMLEFKDGKKEEGIFENHLPLNGGWTETKVNFFINGKLIQRELYHDCVANKPPDSRIFDPTQFKPYR
jgi:hypothetical protein